MVTKDWLAKRAACDENAVITTGCSSLDDIKQVDQNSQGWYDLLKYYLFWIYADQARIIWWQIQDFFSSRGHNE